MAHDNPGTEPINYFSDIRSTNHRRYLALRCFFLEGLTAEEVAREFGYTASTVYSMARDFKKKLEETDQSDPFFIACKPGRKGLDEDDQLIQLVVALRRKSFSVPEIKSILDARDMDVSQRSITAILQKEGFGRLPRRDRKARIRLTELATHALVPPEPRLLKTERETFTSQVAAILCFLPFLMTYGLDKAIEQSCYPDSEHISKRSAILCFLALKLAQINRCGADNTWCMDRGLGLFAGMNVLPDAAWLSDYAGGITHDMNRAFLQSLYRIWQDRGLLSDAICLDSAAIPCWTFAETSGQSTSGTKDKALTSRPVVLARDPDSGIILPVNIANGQKTGQEAVLDFLESYRNKQAKTSFTYLVFDSKGTSYDDLQTLNQANVKFITVRQSRTGMEKRIKRISSRQWKKIRLPVTHQKSIAVRLLDERVQIKGYPGRIRQICMAGYGGSRPLFIITNAYDLPAEAIVWKYCGHWLAEQKISGQIAVFHLNRSPSDMVIDADFDLTMTILAYNLYRLLALQLARHHLSLPAIFEQFIENAGEIELTQSTIEVKLKKRSNLPLLLEQMHHFGPVQIGWLQKRKLLFSAAATT